MYITVIATIAGAPSTKRSAGPRPRRAGAAAASAASPASSSPAAGAAGRIARRQATNTAYVTASIARTSGALKIAITTPAIAGPTRPAIPYEIDSIAFAVVSSSPSTRAGIMLGIPATLVM